MRKTLKQSKKNEYARKKRVKDEATCFSTSSMHMVGTNHRCYHCLSRLVNMLVFWSPQLPLGLLILMPRPVRTPRICQTPKLKSFPSIALIVLLLLIQWGQNIFPLVGWDTCTCDWESVSIGIFIVYVFSPHVLFRRTYMFRISIFVLLFCYLGVCLYCACKKKN